MGFTTSEFEVFGSFGTSGLHSVFGKRVYPGTGVSGRFECRPVRFTCTYTLVSAGSECSVAPT